MRQVLLRRVKDVLTHPPYLLILKMTGETLQIVLGGKKRTVRSTSTRVMNLLLSTYENAVLRNTELQKAQEELRDVNEELEERVYELRVSENRFRSLVRTIPDIVYRIDPQGNFTFVNEAVQRLGYLPEELIGKHFGTIIKPADVPKVDRKTVLESYRGKKTGSAEAPKLFNEQRSGERMTEGLEVFLASRHRTTVEEGFIVPLEPGIRHHGSEQFRHVGNQS
jgi:PAS domain S-box-containing protein